MARFVIALVLCLFSLIPADCRQGWKTDQNGYFIFTNATNFATTNTTVITGKFSTKAYSTNANVVLAVEETDGNFTLQFAVDKGNWMLSMNQGGLVQSSSKLSHKLNTGFVYDFTCTIEQSSKSNGSMEHTVTVTIAGASSSMAMSVIDMRTWNYDTIKIYIGGYRTAISQGTPFEGCLSDVKFQNKDILNMYFSQYPNNTNPVKSLVTSGNFSNVAQMCGDLTSTAPAPETTPTQLPPTTKPNGSSMVTSFASVVLSGLFLAFYQFL